MKKLAIGLCLLVGIICRSEAQLDGEYTYTYDLLETFNKNFLIMRDYTEGNTFIYYSNLPLDFMVDDNPLKQNKFTPGMNLKVFQPEVIREIAEPICFLVPAWNFIEEIETNIELFRAEQPNYIDEIVTYFPEFRVKTLRGGTNEID